MTKLFGTDGIRGPANRHPMTPETVTDVGRALSLVLRKNTKHRPRILIGKDTRLSGYMIESALASGMCSMGADVILAGPVPTPAVAFLTKNMGADAGVMISASHNPFEDNGIKLFSERGFKLNDDAEREIETLVGGGGLSKELPSPRDIGKAFRAEDAIGRYIVFLRHSLGDNLSLEGMKIVVDCAHGSTYKVAPTLLREMRADVLSINANPNGTNINEKSGALHPDMLSKTVSSNQADIGLAFDGDGDRLIACDEEGQIVTGDTIIAICALYLKKTDQLENNTVVTTVMSNLGLTKCLKKHGIQRVEAPVGDRFVLEKMLTCGASLGGEDSGHVIFRKWHTTGDGILTALFLLSIMKSSGQALSELASVMKTYPQILKNIPVRERKPLEKLPQLQKTIKEVEKHLKDRGRVLVRYSGTQPLLRIMVEGPTREATEKYADMIAEAADPSLAADGPPKNGLLNPFDEKE